MKAEAENPSLSLRLVVLNRFQATSPRFLLNSWNDRDDGYENALGAGRWQRGETWSASIPERTSGERMGKPVALWAHLGWETRGA